MRRGINLILVLALAAAAPSVYGQDAKAELQKKLSSEFKRTTLTADRSDIATAGTVLVLHKDNLLMCSMDGSAPPTNTYKNGAISMGFGANMSWTVALSQANQQPANIPQRKFVSGEKFWVADYVVKDDGIIFRFYSDPLDNIRYYGQLKFPISKGAFPPADAMLKTIAEVITPDNPDQEAQPAENAAAPQQQGGTAPAQAPKTISLGQTKEEVVATFGQPKKIVNLGAKQIYYYPDMKVIFTDGKVSDVSDVQLTN
jgi:hypothetical protein